jgi:hypothetical protein
MDKMIFIFSMPKSGSTLLQRIVSTSDRVSTLPETWILLPMFYMLRKNGLYSEFSGRQLHKALRNNILNTGNKNTYFKSVGEFYKTLIKGLSEDPNKEFFLEKTPRYSLLYREIMSTFNDGHFLVLTRNPLMIMSSMMNTYSGGYYNLFRFSIDLKEVFYSISEVLKDNNENILHVRYEDLVSDTENVVKQIGGYLGINLLDSWRLFNEIDLSGLVGDPVGTIKYKTISKQNSSFEGIPLNWVRKAILIRHLKVMGRGNIALQGYNYDELVWQVKSSKFTLNYFISDIFLYLFGILFCVFDFVPLLNKFKSKRFYPSW